MISSRCNYASFDLLSSSAENTAWSSVLMMLWKCRVKNAQRFLPPNELWGGAGSIADEAGVGRGRGLRGKVESALVQLGEEQLRTRLVNPRTATWVAAFKRWRQEGS